MILTCDVESDWGGRTETLQGITEGIPVLLELLSRAQLKGIFFISTHYLDAYLDVARTIAAAGHVLGCHGDRHQDWTLAPWHQWRIDYLHAMTKIEKAFGLKRHQIPYRAPKFSHIDPMHRYSNPQGHVGLLKHLWVGEKIAQAEVFYCHPFDIIQPSSKPPNLWCQFWYSRPYEARQLLERLITMGTFTSCLIS